MWTRRVKKDEIRADQKWDFIVRCARWGDISNTGRFMYVESLQLTYLAESERLQIHLLLHSLRLRISHSLAHHLRCCLRSRYLHSRQPPRLRSLVRRDQADYPLKYLQMDLLSMYYCVACEPSLRAPPRMACYETRRRRRELLGLARRPARVYPHGPERTRLEAVPGLCRVDQGQEGR
jgi:hypothetical protein